MGKSRIVQWALIITTGVVFTLFIVFGVQLVHKAPELVDFCEEPDVSLIPQTENECGAIGGTWVPERLVQTALPRLDLLEPPVFKKVSEGYCDPKHKCSEEFARASQYYERDIFALFIILGIAMFFMARVIRAYEMLGVSFLCGGFLTIGVACVRYWPYMSDEERITVLGILLIALVWTEVKVSKKK